MKYIAVLLSNYGFMLLLFLSLLGLWTVFTSVLRVPIFFAPFLSFCALIVVLYFFSLMGILPLGADILFVAGLISLGWSVARIFLIRAHIGQHPERVLVMLFVTVVACVPLAWAIWKIPAGYYFHENDEYSHWALVTKVIAISGALHGADSGVAFKGYPPGLAMLHYFFVKVIGYTEIHVLVAQMMFTLSALMAASSFLLGSAHGWLYGLIAYAATIVFSYSCGFTFYTIYSDLPLAAIVTAGVAFIIFSKTDPSRTAATIAIICATMSLVRPTGIVFSAFLVAFHCALQAGKMQGFRPENLVSALRAGPVALKSIMPVKFVVGVACTCAMTLMTFLSWRSYSRLIGGELGNVARPLSYFFLPECGRVYLMLQELSDQLLNRPAIAMSISGVATGPSHVMMVVTLILTSLLSCVAAPAHKRRRAIIVTTTFALGWMAYLVFQIYAYASFFSMYEAIRLASLDRYINGFYLTWAVVQLLLLFEYCAEAHYQVKNLLIGTTAGWLLVGALAYVTPGIHKDIKGPALDIGNSDLRKKIERLAELLSKRANITDAAYYVGQNSRGYDFLMFRYLAAPLSRGQNWYWSFGKPYYHGDVWTMSDKTLADAARNYRFLVIGNADAQFWEDNATLFADPSPAVSSGVYENTRVGQFPPFYVKVD